MFTKESNIEKTKNFKKRFGNSKVVKNGKPFSDYNEKIKKFESQMEK